MTDDRIMNGILEGVPKRGMLLREITIDRHQQ